MLEFLSVLDPVRANLVQFYGQFEHRGLTCLAFEMLDTNLYEAIKARKWKPLSVRKIRPIAQQLLEALDALKSMKILHTDIKPDNIMFTNMKNQPLRVKLIDFGLAIPAADVEPGMWMQPCAYRAPEVTLGIEFNESIDVWGVGCTLAFLYLGQNLFPGRCIYQMMKRVVEILGFPQEYLIWSGRYSHCFFAEAPGFWIPWRFLTPEEFEAMTNIKARPPYPSDGIFSLNDLVNMYPKIRDNEVEDRTAFVELLKGLLTFDGTKRWTPSQALDHPFIQMSHLSTIPDSEDYLRISADLMKVCPDWGTPPGAPEQESAELSAEGQSFHLQDRASTSSSELKVQSCVASNKLEEAAPQNIEVNHKDEALQKSASDGATGPDSGVQSKVGSEVMDGLSPKEETPEYFPKDLAPLTSPSDKATAPDSGFQSTVSNGTAPEVLSNKELPPSSESDRAKASDSHLLTGQMDGSTKDKVPPTSASDGATVSDSGVCPDVSIKLEAGLLPNVEALPTSASDGANGPYSGVCSDQKNTDLPKEAPAAVSSSKGLRRIRRFFRRVLGAFCCCLHPNVDD